LLKRKAGATAYDWCFVPKRNYRRKYLVAIDRVNHTGCIRRIDRARCFALIARYLRLTKRFKNEYASVAQRYKEKQPELTSRVFWEQYLQLH
jgi:hypothetical protein